MKSKIVLLVCIFSLLFPNFCFSQWGTLDLTFGIAGKVRNSSGTNIHDSAVQSDGKIIVVGSTLSFNEGSSFVVTRYLANGNVDTSFGTGGSVKTLYGFRCSAKSLHIQNDGKIIVAGSTYLTAQVNSEAAIMLAKYNTNGSLDMSFGTNGVAVLNLPNSQDVRTMVVKADGTIIVGGIFNIQDGEEPRSVALVGFDANGNLNTAFGNNGYVFGDGYVLDMKLTATEDIITVGRGEMNAYMISKYTANGQIVNSFGASGNGTIEFSMNYITELSKCVIANNGDIYATGATYATGLEYKAYTVKYNQAGIIDASFGANGMILRDWGRFIASFGNDIAIDQNNNLIIAYSVGMPTNYDFGVESYDLAGNINTDFGNNGYFTTTFTDSHEYLRAMSIQPDNKIVLSGDMFGQVLARLNNPVVLSNNDFSKNEEKINIIPNPFIFNAELSFEIDKSGKIAVDLFDSKGAFISNLIKDKYCKEGTNSLRLNLSDINLPQGLYFLKVYNDFKAYKTLKLLKK